MKRFEMPMIEVITFTAESVMTLSQLPGAEDRLPWG